MEVLALVGPSGTGKSHHAILVAHEYQVDAIIDDGLLIQGSRIIAGFSSKRQSTKVGAIKTALFVDDAHAEEVRRALKSLQISRLLVLGTSIDMAHRITRRLDLPAPSTIIHIEEIATAREIERARYIREKFGKHVVPAPTVELKPRFSGTLIDPLQTWFRRRNAPRDLPGHRLWVEQSVVRPTFNFLGKFYIANNVIADIFNRAVRSVPGLHRVGRVQVDNGADGVTVHAELVLRYGPPLRPIARAAQQRAIHWIEHMTSLHVLAVNITIKGLVCDEEKPE